jgi:hypothetical protein
VAAAVPSAAAQILSAVPESLVLPKDTVFGIEVTCTECQSAQAGWGLYARTDESNFASVEPAFVPVPSTPFVTIFNVFAHSAGGTILRIKLADSETGVAAAEATITVRVTSDIDDDCIIDDVTRRERDRASTLSLYRRFRDEVLEGSSIGLAYAWAYYRHGPEVIDILRADPDLRAEVRAALRIYRPAVESILDGGTLRLTVEDIEYLTELLNRIGHQAGLELQRTIVDLRSDLQTGKRLRALGVRVERGR